MIEASESTRSGMLDRERLGDHPAERRADDVRRFDPERVQQTGRVGRHVGERVRALRDLARERSRHRAGRSVGEDRRAPGVAIVEADDPKALGRDQLAELVGPQDHLRAQAHDHEQRRIVVPPELLPAQLELAHPGEPLLGGRYVGAQSPLGPAAQ